ncbi:D-hexose-6-phosphate mutarotase [Pasteurellaceae bacterium 22721_9_1]
MNIEKVKQLSPELALYQYNQIPVLELKHAVGEAKIALQGAQLLTWKAKNETHSVLWLSDIDPFTLGNAIRGGIPICYPWFGAAKQPAHGTARIALWELSDYEISSEKVRLIFSLFDQQILQAKVEMQFSEHCQVTFTHCVAEPAQLALHSYFQVGDITQVEVNNLPTTVFNSLTREQDTVPATRQIDQTIDAIYRLEQTTHYINDKKLQRQIEIEHQNATEMVLWNPWHKATSGMKAEDYQQMLCVETARIHTELQSGESVSVLLKVNKK